MRSREGADGESARARRRPCWGVYLGTRHSKVFGECCRYLPSLRFRADSLEAAELPAPIVRIREESRTEPGPKPRRAAPPLGFTIINRNRVAAVLGTSPSVVRTGRISRGLSGRFQDVVVVTVGQHAPFSPRQTVHGPCEPSGDGLHAAPQCIAVDSLDDEMSAVALKRIVNEPKARPRTAHRKSLLDRPDDGKRAERRHVGAHAERDVHGQTREAPAAGMR